MSPNVKVIPANQLYISEPDPSWFGNGPNPRDDATWTNSNWLKSRFHFSFIEYKNPKNSGFGVLRVLNDDLVQPHRGFKTHPHVNMEIITYVVEGSLTHKDGAGTKESFGRGSILFMTAGTGMRHSEFNEGEKPLRFIQMWIVPSKLNLTPIFGACAGSKEKRKNKFQHLVSDVKDTTISTPVKVNQEFDVFASEIDLGCTVNLELPSSKQAYMLCLEGEVTVNGNKLCKHDGCEITGGGGGTLTIEATDVESTENGEVAHVLIFTMKALPESGRSDT